MRNFLKFILIFSLLFNFGQVNANEEYRKLIKAIGKVESGGNPSVVSKNGKYVGYLQISKVVVDDCNRIIGTRKFNYGHRYDKEKSIEMFLIIQNYYNPSRDITKAIRIWNEGPDYNKKFKTTPYLNKVLYEYQNL